MAKLAPCIHIKNSIEVMSGYDTNKIVQVVFDSLFQWYQRNLEESLRCSELVFDSEWV